MRCATCTVRRFTAYGTLEDNAIERIHEMRVEQLSLKKGHLLAPGTRTDPYVYSVREGWAFSFALLRDGRRQILDFYHDGDIIMFPGMESSTVQVGVRCLTNVRVCQFEKKRFFPVLSEGNSKCLDIYFETQKAKLETRLIELGILAAEESVASLIYGVLRRMRERGHEGDIIKFPLRLNEIAEAVGITSIHAGRVMRDLEKREVIQRGPGDMLLVNEDKLAGVLHANIGTGVQEVRLS